MSARFSSCFALALSLAIAAPGCGSEDVDQNVDSVVESDEDEEDQNGEEDGEDGEEDAAKDEDPEESAPAKPALDAGNRDAGGKDAGVPPSSKDSGAPVTSRDAGAAGAAGDGGETDGSDKEPEKRGDGECCADGDCLCHGPAPTALTSGRGSFKTESFRISTGTVTYPTDAKPPFAAVALCGGFTNTGPEMADWAPFYASHGIVTVIVTTTGADIPDIRAAKLLAAVKELKAENTKSGSPLMGKLSDRFGTSGYSMGGGGTTIAAGQDTTLRTSVGLAAWDARGSASVKTPTLLLCGTADAVAPCLMSQTAYDGMTGSTPKMMVTINGVSHFGWFGPTQGGTGGVSGQYALAFQKVYLEGDERWKPLLKSMAAGARVATNIN